MIESVMPFPRGVARLRLWFLGGLLITVAFSRHAEAQTAKESTYRGWKTLALSNRLIEVQVAPEIGGRVIQFTLGDFEYLFVNDELAGKTPPASGLGPDGEWLNYGGEKLWPAPQGWDNDRQWPGPPDAILDGSPHQGRILVAGGDTPTVRLTSRKDPRSGIRFSRSIQVFDRTTRMHVDATMTNIDDKPRRWGIWSVVQHNAANREGQGHNDKLRVYCPMNRKSVFPDGYKVMFGLANNLSWQPDHERGMMTVHFQRRVGKIAVDCSAGWVATVNGQSGHVFVQRFRHMPERPYPDRASVEIWLHGLGQFIVAGELNEMADDPVECPYLIETELLSPFAELEPGQSYTYGYDWYAAAIGGDYPVLDCTEVGVTCEPLEAKLDDAKLDDAKPDDGRLVLRGRFGVFHQGTTGIALLDAGGKRLARAKSRRPVTPTEPLLPRNAAIGRAIPPETKTVALEVYDAEGEIVGELARAALAR